MTKLTKKQRRVAQKMLFPIIALVMMTATMAIAGTGHSTPTSVRSR